MSSIPRDAPFDSTLDLLADGYDFMAKRRQQLHSDIFATRLLLQDVVCLVGPEAARLFFMKTNASPAAARCRSRR